MAVKLIKPVKREMLASSTMGKYRNRPIIVTITGGDAISFRIKGTRQEYHTSLHACYRLAQIAHYANMYEDKRKEYEAKKKAGYRNLRKPKRMNFPIDRAIIDALR